jgi:ribosomal protein L11 methyltransferase
MDASTTVVARLSTTEATARRLTDLLGETYATFEAAIAAFEEPGGAWSVEIYFGEPPDEAALRELVAAATGNEDARALTLSRVAAKDWVAASLAGLAPVAAGRFLVHGAHDRARLPAQAIGIEIEAALAFGTGHHGTTRGCLLALDTLLKPELAPRPRRAARRRNGAKPIGRRDTARAATLDVGTGTGILAIAAAKATRRRVVGSDIDARSVEIARGNARANHVGGLVTVVHAGGLAARRLRACAPYRLVLANILLPPLKRMAAAMTRLVAPNGHVILSGLLDSQAAAAIAAYRAQGLALVRRRSLAGWTTLVLVHRSRKRQRPGRYRPRR